MSTRCLLAWFAVVLAGSTISGLATQPTAQARGLLICPSSQRTVERGDRRYTVRARCGEPDEVATRYEARKVRVGNAARAVSVAIEAWFYDWGPKRLTRTLYFEDGRLAGVTTGDYGQKEHEQSSRR